MKESLKNILLAENYLYCSGKIAAQSPSNGKNQNALVGAILRSFGSLGYALDGASIKMLCGADAGTLASFYKEAYAYLAKFSGASYNVKKVFYNTFPELPDISVEEMYFNASLHYLTVFFKDIMGDLVDVYYPEEEPSVRLPFSENVKPKVLKIVTPGPVVTNVLYEYYHDAFSAPVAIPETNKETMADLLAYLLDKQERVIPNEIPFKENVVFYVSLISSTIGFASFVKNHDPKLPFLKTVTDYLRLYRMLSTGNAMLGDRRKNKSFPRAVRRWFLKNLEEILLKAPATEKEFAAHRELWIRVFESLHPGEYALMYPLTYQAASKLRSGTLHTFNSDVEKAYASRDLDTVLELLSTRPGVFARQLDRLLCHFPDRKDMVSVISAFFEVAPQVSVPVLLQLREHFLNRNAPGPRIFSIKTQKGVKIHAKEETRDPFVYRITDNLAACLGAAIGEAVKVPYPPKVFVDGGIQAYANYTLPTNDRAASDNVMALPFGSFYEVGSDKDVVRLFTHWKNAPHVRVDIDLSAQYFDADFNLLGSLSWHNLNDIRNGIYFSGDVTDAPKGANEFIDIQIDAFKQKHKGARYVVILNNLFSGPAFKDIPECFTGAMLREGLGKTGEIFEASTVVAKFNLTQDKGRENIAAVFDLDERRLYCIDQPTVFGGAIGITSFNAVSQLVRRAVQKHTTLGDMLGFCDGKSIEIVTDPELASECEYRIGLDENADVHPWNQEKISKLLLQNVDIPEKKD